MSGLLNGQQIHHQRVIVGAQIQNNQLKSHFSTASKNSEGSTNISSGVGQESFAFDKRTAPKSMTITPKKITHVSESKGRLDIEEEKTPLRGHSNFSLRDRRTSASPKRKAYGKNKDLSEDESGQNDDEEDDNYDEENEDEES